MDPPDPFHPVVPLVQFRMAGPIALLQAVMLFLALTPSEPVHYSENWLRYSGRVSRRCARVTPYLSTLDFYEFVHNASTDEAYDGDGA